MYAYKLICFLIPLPPSAYSHLLSQKYRASVETPLAYTPPGADIRMAWEEHRAIFGLYFALLSATLLWFLYENKAVVRRSLGVARGRRVMAGVVGRRASKREEGGNASGKKKGMEMPFPL